MSLHRQSGYQSRPHVTFNMLSQLAVLLSLFLSIANSIPTEGRNISAVGKVLCAGRGLIFSEVSLFDGNNSSIGKTNTSAQGEFKIDGILKNVSTHGSISLSVDYYHTRFFGRFALSKKDRVTFNATRYAVQDLGTIHFDNNRCHAYHSFLKAALDYVLRMRGPLPFGLRIEMDTALHRGLPYAYYGEVRIPPNYNISENTAKHELGHVIRHRLDGGFLHWLWDVFRFKYWKPHDCSKVTNRGFAFNEGWAEFWAGNCMTHSAGGDENVEGNVAAGLRDIQKRCGTSDKEMVEVLRNHKRRIHYLTSFKAAHQNMYSCSWIRCIYNSWRIYVT